MSPTSLEYRLNRRLLTGIVALVIVFGASLGVLLSLDLSREFDRSLASKARAVVDLYRLQPPAGSIQVTVENGDQPTYLALRLRDGSIREPSGQLQLGPSLLERTPRFQDVVLPGGRAGRQVEIEFIPATETANGEGSLGAAPPLVTLMVAEPLAPLYWKMFYVSLILAAFWGLLLLALALLVRSALQRGLEPIVGLKRQLEILDLSTSPTASTFSTLRENSCRWSGASTSSCAGLRASRGRSLSPTTSPAQASVARLEDPRCASVDKALGRWQNPSFPTYKKEVQMPRKLIAVSVVPAMLLGFAFVSACQAGVDDQAAQAEEAVVEEAPVDGDAGADVDAGPSLYDRLGGVYNIAAVADDLIDRLAANDALNANPGISAARVPARFPGLKFQLTAMVCQATGGPCSYTGMSMSDAHVNMGITEADWELFEADFKATLDKFGVPEAEQQELFAITSSTKADIVVAE